MDVKKLCSTEKNMEGFYPTPHDLAQAMVQKVDFTYVTTVLEPSAGKGDLAVEILRQMSFYDSQEEAIVEDTFRQAILRYGKFDACYFDNGSQYIARQIRLSLSRLGIRVLHAKPRSGKSKGYVKIYITKGRLKSSIR